MKKIKLHRSSRLIPYLFILLILAACNTEKETPTPASTPTLVAIAAATETAEPTNTPSPTPTELPPTNTPTPSPTETPTPTATPTQTPLEQAQAATVRIIGQGSDFLETLIGPGTGIIYDDSGLILTSNDLVDGAGLVQVSIEGREEALSAQIVGRSVCDNLAVLQLLGSGYPAINLSSDNVPLNSPIQIVGYLLEESSPITLEGNLLASAEEIIPTENSALTGTLQLDTALNTGLNGAPVLDENGTFDGLIVHPGNNESDHAALLPLSSIMPVLAQLEEGDNLNWIGINAGLITAEEANLIGVEATPGLFVYAVDFRGPAGTADLRNGDVITEIDGRDLTGHDGYALYCAALRDYTEGDPLDITVVRDNSRYLGQINGDPLTEEVIVQAPSDEGTAPPPAADTQSQLLATIQSTDANMRSVGGTIDSLATNGCLGPAFFNDSTDDPISAGPTTDSLAHPGCIHNISDCQLILDRYALITNPPAINLNNASQELIDASASLQAAIDVFVGGATPLIEACRPFINDPSLTINPLAFGLARQGIDNALNILAPTLQSLQS